MYDVIVAFHYTLVMLVRLRKKGFEAQRLLTFVVPLSMVRNSVQNEEISAALEFVHMVVLPE